MNEFVKKIFLIIAVLVFVFIGWQIMFNDGGFLQTSYNAIAVEINKNWANTHGEGEELLSRYGEPEAQNNSNSGSGGFDINVN
ncbi:hypothetical protein [[Clostridium] fimetarium]|uniref:Uncharacterized protein n=1 Tax=[Clostridium] fimetarium TaxID=99656 RepID=A0A1I0RE10_9FIRM|nr:hypothetical protein [[Clostridium] fimetarium]SEW38988.1 hypothetical protein SAMN05421659_11475 [[Clostridium] fimetarium]